MNCKHIQSCQQQGHENNEVSFICVEQKCQMSRFVCQQCLFKDVHRHGKNNNNHIQNAFDFENKIKSDIKEFYAKSIEPKKEVDQILKQFQELKMTFQKILTSLDMIIDNLNLQFNKEELANYSKQCNKQNFKNLDIKQVEQLLSVQYKNFQFIDHREIYKESFQLIQKAYQSCLVVAKSSLFQQKSDDKIALFMETISKPQKGYELLQRGKAFESAGFNEIAFQFYGQVVADKHEYYYHEEAYKQMIKLLDLKKDFTKLCELNQALIQINRKYAKDWLDQLVTVANQLINDLKYDEAIDILDIAIQIDSKFIPSYQIKAEIYQKQQQNVLVHLMYQKIIDINPKLDDILYKNGLLYFEEKQFGYALNMFTKASELNYRNETFLIKRGMAWIQVRQYEQAHKVFDSVLKLNQNNSKAYLQKGITYIKQGNFESATQQLKQSLTLEQNNEETYYHLGFITYQQKNYAILIKQEYLDALLLLGQTYYFVKQYPKALQNFHKTLQINPDNADALYYKSVILTEIGQYKEAEDILSKLIFKVSNDERYYLQAGQLMEDQGNLKEAQNLYEKAMQINPKSAYCIYHIGALNLKLKLYEKADELFNKAATLNPKFVLPLLGLGDIAYKKWQYQKALEIYRIVLEVERKNAKAVNGIASICFQLKGNLNQDTPDQKVKIYVDQIDDILKQWIHNLIENFDLIVSSKPKMLFQFICLACAFYNNENYDQAYLLFNKLQDSFKEKNIIEKCQFIHPQAQFVCDDQKQIFPLCKEKFQKEILKEYSGFTFQTDQKFNCKGDTFLIQLAIQDWSAFRNKLIQQIETEKDSINQPTEQFQFEDAKMQFKQI